EHVEEGQQQEVAGRVPGQRAALEAVLQHRGPGRGRVGEGRHAAAEVAEAGDRPLLAQPTGGAAVVGGGHDGGHPGRPRERGAEAGRQAVAAADGDDPGHRSMSRWTTVGSKPCARRISATSSAMATERWRPPVHPKAMVRYDLPSATYAGRSVARSSRRWRMRS